MEKINQVSIRLVNERPLLSEEQLTSPEKVAMVVSTAPMLTRLKFIG